jgi:ribosomal protein L11 methylase PrmA
MFKLAMGGKVFHAPLQDPKRILDIGTGSGIWPMDMGMINCSNLEVPV